MPALGEVQGLRWPPETQALASGENNEDQCTIAAAPEKTMRNNGSAVPMRRRHGGDAWRTNASRCAALPSLRDSLPRDDVEDRATCATCPCETARTRSLCA